MIRFFFSLPIKTIHCKNRWFKIFSEYVHKLLCMIGIRRQQQQSGRKIDTALGCYFKCKKGNHSRVSSIPSMSHRVFFFFLFAFVYEIDVANQFQGVSTKIRPSFPRRHRILPIRLGRSRAGSSSLSLKFPIASILIFLRKSRGAASLSAVSFQSHIPRSLSLLPPFSLSLSAYLVSFGDTVRRTTLTLSEKRGVNVSYTLCWYEWTTFSSRVLGSPPHVLSLVLAYSYSLNSLSYISIHSLVNVAIHILMQCHPFRDWTFFGDRKRSILLRPRPFWIFSFRHRCCCCWKMYPAEILMLLAKAPKFILLLPEVIILKRWCAFFRAFAKKIFHWKHKSIREWWPKTEVNCNSFIRLDKQNIEFRE